MNALRLGSALSTLVLAGTEAQLWDGEGRLLGALGAESPGPSRRRAWAAVLRELLPREARVQILVRDGELEVECQEAPYLSPRECQEALRRFSAAGSASHLDWACVLDADPLAEGGHRLWIVKQDRRLMEDAVEALASIGAVPVFATAWPRAFLASLPPGASTRFVLALEQGLGRILLFEGRSLLLTRMFRLPEEIRIADLDEAGEEILAVLLGEELARTLQFVKQKFRGVAVRQLELMGLPEALPDLEARLRRALNLELKGLPGLLESRLLAGMASERGARHVLNLLPAEVQDARKLRLLRLTVWSAAAVVCLGLLGGQALLNREGRALERAVDEARESRDRRVRLLAEAEGVARLRAGLLRVRLAERMQKASAERIEALGLLLFRVPEGMTLDRVSLLPSPGGADLRLEVEGSALTRKAFSVGPLAEYLARLNAHAGLQMEPLQEVSVSDRISVQGGREADSRERAVTRFRLKGVVR